MAAERAPEQPQQITAKDFALYLDNRRIDREFAQLGDGIAVARLQQIALATKDQPVIDALNLIREATQNNKPLADLIQENPELMNADVTEILRHALDIPELEQHVELLGLQALGEVAELPSPAQAEEAIKQPEPAESITEHTDMSDLITRHPAIKTLLNTDHLWIDDNGTKLLPKQVMMQLITRKDGGSINPDSLGAFWTNYMKTHAPELGKKIGIRVCYARKEVEQILARLSERKGKTVYIITSDPNPTLIPAPIKKK